MSYLVPDNLKYTKEHEWALVEGTIAIIGITDYAQKELGDIVHIEMPVIGIEIKQGDVCGFIEAVKTVAELYSPVSGKVIEVNNELIEYPEHINRDPYSEGWIFKVEIVDPDEITNLLDADDYKRIIGE